MENSKFLFTKKTILLTCFSLLIIFILSLPQLVYLYGIGQVGEYPKFDNYKHPTGEQSDYYWNRYGGKTDKSKKFTPWDVVFSVFCQVNYPSDHWCNKKYLPLDVALTISEDFVSQSKAKQENNDMSWQLKWHPATLAYALWIQNNWTSEQIVEAATELQRRNDAFKCAAAKFDKKDDNQLFFGNYLVGIKSVKLNTLNIEKSQDRVVVVNTDNCSEEVLDKDDFLPWRPATDLKKIDSNSFSYLITATPHYGHRFTYNLKTKKELYEYIADECYLLSSASGLSKETIERFEKKCKTNPEFITLDKFDQQLIK